MIGNTETSHFPWYIIGTIDILIEWYYTTTSAAWYKVGAMYPVTSQNVDKPERRFGLSTFRFVDVSVCRLSVCRRFGLSTFWFVDALVYRRFDLWTYWFIDVLAVDVSVCRRFDQLPFLVSTSEQETGTRTVEIIHKTLHCKWMLHKWRCYQNIKGLYLHMELKFTQHAAHTYVSK